MEESAIAIEAALRKYRFPYWIYARRATEGDGFSWIILESTLTTGPIQSKIACPSVERLRRTLSDLMGEHARRIFAALNQHDVYLAQADLDQMYSQADCRKVDASGGGWR